MILKEFDLDLPYIEDIVNIKKLMKENQWDMTKATQNDYFINWKEKRIQFRDEIRCVASMYERFLKKFKTDDCWKILIECYEKITDTRIRNLLGVYTVQIEFEINDFFMATDNEKKIITLELLRRGVERIVNEKNWDRTYFDEAYYEVIKVEYMNNWIWKKPVKSPNKALSAEVFCEHFINHFDISIIIRSQDDTEVRRERILSDKPNEFSYARHLGLLKWLAEDEIALINKEGNQQWSVKI